MTDYTHIHIHTCRKSHTVVHPKPPIFVFSDMDTQVNYIYTLYIHIYIYIPVAKYEDDESVTHDRQSLYSLIWMCAGYEISTTLRWQQNQPICVYA
jgi:hypothetical protein